jgi:hypothetical protein
VLAFNAEALASEMTTIITSQLLLVWLLAWSVNAQRNQFTTSEVTPCGSSGLTVSNFGAMFVLAFCSHPHLLSICRYHRFTRQLDYAAVLTAQQDGLSPRSNNKFNENWFFDSTFPVSMSMLQRTVYRPPRKSSASAVARLVVPCLKVFKPVRYVFYATKPPWSQRTFLP